MSLYNAINGMNGSLVLLMSPFLPIRADDFPRFRNVFTEAEDSPYNGDIFVYTRMGGGNRECSCGGDGVLCSACEADSLEESENCVGRYDDDFDCTYSTFVFRASDGLRDDYALLTGSGKTVGDLVGRLSDDYKRRLRELFPNNDATPKVSLAVGAICGDLTPEQIATLEAAVTQNAALAASVADGQGSK